MDIDEARAFIGENHRAVLATRRRDGRPQLSPVAVGVDEQGRTFREEWGWIGQASDPRRRYVRRITLERPHQEFCSAPCP